jgi:hypothetical protein
MTYWLTQLSDSNSKDALIPVARTPVERRKDAGLENLRFCLQPIFYCVTLHVPVLLIELACTEANLPLYQVHHETVLFLRTPLPVH